jgi:hypothetical protein
VLSTNSDLHVALAIIIVTAAMDQLSLIASHVLLLHLTTSLLTHIAWRSVEMD